MHPPDSTQQTWKLVQENTESIPVNVETSDTTNTVKVETPVQTDSGNKSSKTVPCLKDLKVVVQKLDDLVNEESTGRANSPVETELKPIITSVCGYNLRSSRPYEEDTDDNDDEPKHKRSKRARPSRSGPSPERLLAHTNALIKKVSSLYQSPQMSHRMTELFLIWKHPAEQTTKCYLWKHLTVPRYAANLPSPYGAKSA